MMQNLRSRFWRFVLRKVFKERPLPLEQDRARSMKIAKTMNRVPKGVEVERIDIDGLRAAWIRPVGADKDKVILYLHGGGYVTGSIESHLVMCCLMAQTLKTKLLLLDYRLAPEHPFPAALEDTLKVYRWLLAQGTRPAEIILSGDSAGGGLSVAAALALRDAVESVPAAVICISPWADLTCAGNSQLTKAEAEAVLKTEVLKEWALRYTDEANLTTRWSRPFTRIFTDSRRC